MSTTEALRESLDPVKDYTVSPAMGAADLVEALFQAGGFSAKKLAIAAGILAKCADARVTTILSFPAAMVATGLRGVIAQMIRDGVVDAVITTCGTLDHDLARTWRDYYQGSFAMDDKDLHQRGVNRLGSVLVPNESYGEILEARLQPWLAEMFGERAHWSTKDLSREFGRRLAAEPRTEHSILRAAYERDVPVFVPGPTDGAVGSQVWLHSQKRRGIGFDLIADEEALASLVYGAKELGAVMLGGGISKHHAIWWSQFRDGLDHAVYVTTAQEHDGSLSGARLEEAISWGKLKEDARFVNIEGDATLVLPLIYAASRARR